MKKAWMLWVVTVLAGCTALAADLSGMWSSAVTFAAGSVSATHTFTLRLTGWRWQLTSSWDRTSRDGTNHALVLKTSLGPVKLTSGATFRLAPPVALARATTGEGLLGSADGFSFRTGYISLVLAVGNLTLKLTLHSGPAD